MKAIVAKRAGSADSLTLTDVPKPAPNAGEVLVRVVATSVTRGDVVMRRMPRVLARLLGETPRSIPGYEFAGRVEDVGRDVDAFGPGDRVFGTTAGLAQGSHAEYLCVPEGGIVTRTPANVDDEHAAVTPVGAMTALHFLRAGGVGRGQHVLINGASGSVGSFAVQIARHMGARVTGVASTSNLEFVAALGADDVIDYTKQHFAEGGRRYDVVFDASATTTARKAEAVLAHEGRFVTTRTRRRERVEDLRSISDMLESGALKALIDRRYPLERIGEAHRYVEEGGKRGNVVVLVAGA